MFARSVFRRRSQYVRQKTYTTRIQVTKERQSNIGVLLVAGALALGGAYYVFNKQQQETEAAQRNIALNNDWKDFVLEETEDVSADTKIFRFKLDSQDDIVGLPVASCLLTRAPIGDDDKMLIRPYTPVTGDEVPGHFDLLVKEYPKGNMSKYIHNLKPGEKLSMKGPISKLPMHQNKYADIGMIAGGTGITPMLQVIKYLLNHPADQTRIWLVYGNVSESDILAREEIEALRHKHPHRFRVHYTLDKAPEGWTHSEGYMTKDMLKRRLPPPGYHNKILVCGPPGMVGAIAGPKNPDYTQGELKGVLKELDYLPHMVYKF